MGKMHCYLDNNSTGEQKVEGRPKGAPGFSKKGLIGLVAAGAVLTGLAIAGDKYFLRSVDSEYFKAQDAIVQPYAQKAKNFEVKKGMYEARNSNQSCK